MPGRICSGNHEHPGRRRHIADVPVADPGDLAGFGQRYQHGGAGSGFAGRCLGTAARPGRYAALAFALAWAVADGRVDWLAAADPAAAPLLCPCRALAAVDRCPALPSPAASEQTAGATRSQVGNEHREASRRWVVYHDGGVSASGRHLWRLFWSGHWHFDDQLAQPDGPGRDPPHQRGQKLAGGQHQWDFGVRVYLGRADCLELRPGHGRGRHLGRTLRRPARPTAAQGPVALADHPARPGIGRLLFRPASQIHRSRSAGGFLASSPLFFQRSC